MPRIFYLLLGNNLVANITNFTVWFAITFWIFIETQSVFATGMVAGIYLVLTAGLAFWFGSVVDHNAKRLVMMASSLASLGFYVLAMIVLLLEPERAFNDPYGPYLWLFVLLSMLGVIAGNMRSIVLPTLVSMLIAEDRRDKANGFVGMVGGLGFLTTSAISGFLVAYTGMFGTLLVAIGLSALVYTHLLFVRFVETNPDANKADDAVNAPPAEKRVDIAGTILVIAAVPGLFALIFFTTFNNFLGGVFMALLDAYALSMITPETWGVLLAMISSAFIFSGFLVSRVGLGKQPLRTLLSINLATWTICIFFTIQPSVLLLCIGCFGWMFLAPIAEAAEQTTLQRVVPFERQGRVFGFAQSVEQMASPITAFLIGPLTQFIFIPYMTDGAGAAAIGSWFGTGPARGMALVFIIAGIIGLIVTTLAFNSRAYKRLSAAYVSSAQTADAPV
jgi:DHA3 family multidrug efflux protein-like MFS transporter